MSNSVVSAAGETYRPLSLLAVIGLGVSFLSASIYLFWSEWMVVLPLLGFVLSAAALRRIKRADNALAGAGVARAGMALALVVGLSWVTMQITMTLVLQAEATAFLEDWLRCMREGKEGLAFVATVRPGSRPATLTAEDLEPRLLRARYPSPAGAAYDLFLACPIVELFVRAGKDLSWQRIGVDEFYYYEGSWYFKLRYRVDTAEMEGDIVFVVASEQVERPSGPRREWRVDVNNSTMRNEGTIVKPFGVELSQARSDALRVLNQWIGDVALGKKEKARELLADVPYLLAEYEKLYAALRGGETGSIPVLSRHRQPLVLQAAKEGTQWQMTLRTTVETGPREVDCQFTLTHPDLNSDQAYWQIIDLKYLGDRKRPEMMAPDLPPLPEPTR
jgi:hypothetical protein